MPRRVDHAQRRRQIAEALWRLAAGGGLEEVSMRRVADEAGVSTRLVQYYFGPRLDLLMGALELLGEDTTTHVQERLAATAGEDPAPREVLRAILVEMLPVEERARLRHLVHVAYFVRALSDAALAARLTEGAPAVTRLVVDLLGRGRERGEVPAELDLRAEAELLINSIDGLQTAVMLGTRSLDRTLELIDHQLDRLFTG